MDIILANKIILIYMSLFEFLVYLPIYFIIIFVFIFIFINMFMDVRNHLKSKKGEVEKKLKLKKVL